MMNIGIFYNPDQAERVVAEDLAREVGRRGHTAKIFSALDEISDVGRLIVLGGDGTQYATLEAAKAAGAAVLAYGSFLAAVVDFLLIALCIFFMLRLVSKLRLHKKRQEEPQQPAAPRLCPYCRMEVAADATRCPHCTSVLEEPDAGVKD